MGKVDDMRAMREARYRQTYVGRGGVVPGSGSDKPPVPIEPSPTAPVGKSGQAKARDPQDLCGHMSMSKKTCTRPKDHPEKNHRYS